MNTARQSDWSIPAASGVPFDPVAICQFFTSPIDTMDFRAVVDHFMQRVFLVQLLPPRS